MHTFCLSEKILNISYLNLSVKVNWLGWLMNGGAQMIVIMYILMFCEWILVVTLYPDVPLLCEYWKLEFGWVNPTKEQSNYTIWHV